MTLVVNSHKWTLLKLVNNILSSCDAEEVEGIDDTVEASQVVDILEATYDSIVTRREFEKHRTAFQLMPYGGVAEPTHLTLPTSVAEVIAINVKDADGNYHQCEFLRPDEFLSMANKCTTGVQVTDPTGITFKVADDKTPQYFTTFGDNLIVFDSYDKDAGVNIAVSDTQCVGYTVPQFSRTDTFVPDLPEDAMSYLLEDSRLSLIHI